MSSHSPQTDSTDIRAYLKNLRPRTAEGVETFEEDGAALLYNPAATHAVALNTSALAILDLCDGRRTTTEIAGLLAEETGEDPATIFASVVDALLQLREKRVVEIDGLARTRENDETRDGAAGFYEDRLDFRLPEFTRISWVDDEARGVWEERLQRIQQAWQEIEWRSVLAGARRCALISTGPENLVDLSGKLVEAGLTALPVAVHDGSQGYSSATTAPKPGKPVRLRVAVGSPADTLSLKTALQANDNATVGELLGYPACCRAFFDEVWVQRGMIDTTWPMARNSNGRDPNDPDPNLIDISSQEPWQANILWRWMGVRGVPHLPCSFQCTATTAFAESLAAVGREAGFTEEAAWIEEILSWPVEWSALHGIAEVKTPVLKVSTRSDATAHKFVVQKRGGRYPPEGASGLSFPYRQSMKPGRRPSSPSGPDTWDAAAPAEQPSWYATDNGFESMAAMRQAHAPIVDLATRTLSTQGGGASVLDLGCGNGALLEAIAARRPGVVPFGIESDAEKAAHARQVLPGFADNIVAGDMFDDIDALFDDDTRYTLALLMPGRLLEVDSHRTEALTTHLARRAGSILLYAYGDWLTRFGGLDGLLSECGLEVPGVSDRDASVITDAGVFRR